MRNTNTPIDDRSGGSSILEEFRRERSFGKTASVLEELILHEKEPNDVKHDPLTDILEKYKPAYPDDSDVVPDENSIRFPQPDSAETVRETDRKDAPNDAVVLPMDAPRSGFKSSKNITPFNTESSIREKELPIDRQKKLLMFTVDLYKSYRKSKIMIPVLKGVNLGIREGEFLSIVGQSGSGKSTLLHLLGTLDVPDTGSIHFEGKRIDNVSRKQRDYLRNHKIGLIFQFYHLLPELTTLENVLSPLMIRHGVFSYLGNWRHNRKLAMELLDKVGLSHRFHHKPSELSGGEMQRAAIARALITDPQILLADEPTGNLDARSAIEIIELLRKLNEDRNLTIVMVTHDMLNAEKADRIVRLVDGKVANGTE